MYAMDGLPCFDDSLFEDLRKSDSHRNNAPFVPNCLDDLVTSAALTYSFQSFLSVSDEESLKATCDWLYLNGQYARCLNVVENLLENLSSTGGFMTKAYAEYAIKCHMKLKQLERVPKLLLTHVGIHVRVSYLTLLQELSVTSLEDHICHLCLHLDSVRLVGSSQDVVCLLQCLLLVFPTNPSMATGCHVPSVQSAWWHELSISWNEVLSVAHVVQTFPPWFATLAELFAQLTDHAQDVHITWNPPELSETQITNCLVVARDILAKSRLRETLERPSQASAVHQCPVCAKSLTDRSPYAETNRLFYETFVSPFLECIQ
ncbi:hypothetical protein EG68_05369 [Paragonimus skrjabini miyazakii]|uniref:Uncharacterized protein n=1 Tax=Paragonimus skrjabini miyazakii TaxID=59628 RepID=A0A8S9YR28_9TREM|nr:hypothetical protein EG68_05369 [Paragonimus skrjabini miyazakii]